MSFSSFFNTKSPPQKFIPHELLTALKNLYTTEYKRIHLYYRDLESLRLNLLKITIENIEAHLKLDPDNLRVCKLAITHLLCNNLQQTKNYCRWNKIKNIPPGEIHRVCGNLIPSALIDALIILRSRLSRQIIYITETPASEENESSESISVKAISREFFSLDDLLKNIDAEPLKNISDNPYIKLLKQEIDFEKKFSSMKIDKLFKRSQDLLTRAKNLHTFHREYGWDLQKILEFKRALNSLSASLENQTLLILNEYVIYLESLSDLIEQGNFLARKVEEMIMMPVFNRSESPAP